MAPEQETAGHQGSSSGEGRVWGQRRPPGSRWRVSCLWHFPSELLCLSRPHANGLPPVSPPRRGPGMRGLLHPQTLAGHRGAPALWGSHSCLTLLRWAPPDLAQFLCCDRVCYLGISRIGFNFSVSSMVVRMASVLPFVGELGWTLLCPEASCLPLPRAPPASTPPSLRLSWAATHRCPRILSGGLGDAPVAFSPHRDGSVEVRFCSSPAWCPLPGLGPLLCHCLHAAGRSASPQPHFQGSLSIHCMCLL